MTMTDSAGGKRALLIAIDDYPLMDGANLQGCVNDMTALAGVLRSRFGFPEENVRLVLDAQATRDGILGALDGLAASVAPDDVVVIAYAGHGSQITDLEGDEPDGLDETIVPYDSGRGLDRDGAQRPNRDITDDELHRALARIGQQTSYITVVFDCCHSGSGMRDLENRHRAVPADTRGADELGRTPLPDQPAPGGDERSRRGWIPLSGRCVFLAGCSDEERAWELTVPGADGPVQHGAFSYFFMQELERIGPGDTMRDIVQRMSTKIIASRPWQHPQAEGQLDREVFGVRDIAPVRTVAVLGRKGPIIRLDAGLVQGVTVGSRYAIRSAAASDRDLAPLCTVEVAAVRAVDCDTRVVGELDEQGWVPGLRALEVAHAFAASRDPIEVLEAPDLAAPAEQLRGLIDASAFLSLARPGEPALARVSARVLPGRADAAHWTAFSPEGSPILPAYPLALPGSAAQLCEALEQRARRRRVLALDNPAPTSRLRGKLGLALLRQGQDGAWIPATPDARGKIMFQQEDRLAVEVTNRSELWVYVYLLDLGLMGGISAAYPPEGAHEELAPGRTIQWFVRDEEAAQVFLPDGYPFEIGRGERPAPEPTVLKLIASTQRLDLGPLFQPGYQAPQSRAGAPLVEGVLASLLGGSGRDTRVAKAPPPGDDWATAAQAYYIEEP